MSQVRVTRQFKINFDTWAEYVVENGEWTEHEIEEFKQLMRSHELADGPDRLRDTLIHYTPEGIEKPSAINDPKERYEYWDRYFSARVSDIQRERLKKKPA